jgi:hypothetical protein
LEGEGRREAEIVHETMNARPGVRGDEKELREGEGAFERSIIGYFWDAQRK